MSFSEDKDKEFQRREVDLKNKEIDLRLREIEIEINQQSSPAYQTKKHIREENKLTKNLEKLVNFVKFFVFVIIGISLTKAGLILGIWLSNFIILSIVCLIGYKIFLDKNDT
jgi:hypothetical protein